MPAANIDTTNTKASYVDSVKLLLTMYKGGFAGDSVVPMGVSVHRLTKQLPTDMYSNFDPTGYYDVTPMASAAYSALLDGSPYAGTDSEGSQYKHIAVDLPRQFGVDLFNLYLDSPETLSSPQAFAKMVSRIIHNHIVWIGPCRSHKQQLHSGVLSFGISY